jgi:hypothetical protein
MIKTFAFDPEALKDPELSARLSDFGYEHGRLIGIVPENWRDQITLICSEIPQGRLKRIEGAIEELRKQRVIKVVYNVTNEGAWIDTATSVSDAYLQGIIVADKDGREDARLIDVDDIASLQSSWNVPRYVLIPRNAKIMAQQVSMFMQHANEIRFVDPYYSAKTRQLAFIRECLRIRRSFSVKSRLFFELHFSQPGSRGDDFAKIESLARDSFPRIREETMAFLKKWIQPHDVCTLFQWTDVCPTVTARFHERYVLTELGGVEYGGGLDTGKDGQDTSVSLLDSESLLKLNRRYSCKGKDLRLLNAFQERFRS